MNRQIKVRIFLKEMYEFPDFTEMDTEDFIDMEKLLNRGGKMIQFTGLKDKNEEEIYFGDVCRIEGTDSRGDYHNHTELIEDWHNVVSSYGLENAIDGGLTIEVLGNIYENSKLLKSK